MKHWKASLLFLAGAALFYSVGAVLAPPWASATNASVSYSQTCSTATVTVVSQWGGGTIHGVITGPSPEIAFDVPPLGTAKATFKILPNPLTVTVTSSNGHLTGELTHTFTVDPCGAPTTTTPPTTAPGIVPGPTTGATTSSPPQTTAPTPSTSPESPTSPAPPATTAVVLSQTSIERTPTTARLSLPPTGSSDVLIVVAIVAASAVLVGLVLVSARRVDNWKRGRP